MKPVVLALAVCVMGFGMNAARAADVGQKAPDFEATDDQGQSWKSSDHVGKGVLVVYFYPAAMTGGCTKQACGFRDDMKTLKAKGVDVVAVSGDEVRNLELFKKVHDLNFTLLSDEDGKVAKAFGVPLKAGGVFKSKIDGKVELLKRGVTSALDFRHRQIGKNRPERDQSECPRRQQGGAQSHRIADLGVNALPVNR